MEHELVFTFLQNISCSFHENEENWTEKKYCRAINSLLSEYKNTFCTVLLKLSKVLSIHN